MKLHILQHAAYEGPGEIATWAQERGHTVSISHLYRGDALPALQDFDALVIMGGEMNIYQYRDWPWLQAESEFIQAALHHGKPAVGICLGAQFLADALGSRVVQNPVYELGWFPVFWTAESRDWFPKLPSGGPVLHWHGDRFSLPMGATRLAISLGCHEQGFIVPGKALALQFHMEVNPALVKLYVESQGSWPSGKYVQDPSQILSEAGKYCEANRHLLHDMLDEFFVEMI
jgi:GMP synthase-like glutamine amidotransferase